MHPPWILLYCPFSRSISSHAPSTTSPTGQTFANPFLLQQLEVCQQKQHADPDQDDRADWFSSGALHQIGRRSLALVACLCHSIRVHRHVEAERDE